MSTNSLRFFPLGGGFNLPNPYLYPKWVALSDSLPKHRGWKRENSDFYGENLQFLHLNQVVKINLTGNVMLVSEDTLPIQFEEKGALPPWYIVFPKSITQPSREKTSNSNWGAFHKIPDQYFSKVSQEKVKKLSDRRALKTRDSYSLCRIPDWILDQKDVGGKTGEIQMKSAV